MKHLMLDFETLGQASDTAVLSLGAVLFTKDQIIEEKYWIFSLDEQLRAKLSITSDTLLWWMQQNDRAKEIFSKVKTEGISMKTFLPDFCGWVNGKDVRVWGNGASFDVSIIESLINRGQLMLPWKFWNIRCYRTLKAMHDIEKGVVRSGTHHNALDDAKYQAQCLMAFLQKNPSCDK